MGGFWSDAWTSFKAIYGPILTVAAFVLALLGPFYVPGASVELRVVWLAVAGVVAAVIAMTVTNMLHAAPGLAGVRLPRVIHVDVAVPIMQGEPGPTTLLLEQSELFGLNQPVTISYSEKLETGQVFERKIGNGYVLNTQMNGLIQVRVSGTVSNHRELWQRIRSRESVVLAQMAIRPSVSIDEDES